MLRSSSTPFLRSFLATSSPTAPSSLQLRRAFSDGHLPSLHPAASSDGDSGKNNSTGAGLHTELSFFSIYNTFNKTAAAAPAPPPPPPVQEPQQAAQPPELPLFLARGLGIDRIASGLFTVVGTTGKAGESSGTGRMNAVVEEHDEKVAALDAQYKKMMDEQPGNALFLRNYAHFLHEVKGDPRRAEEYYSRAMLADPSDGEIMSQYAKLVWEVHRDHDRSLAYFHKSVQAAPHNR
ncbi:hypothetical protein GUJ93_ZPchr0014g46990 [Zizania palustris]|uniref:TmcB/TmcC TPR repeats domain-containing protein n=1 Tax=Zizania palustris TaxID=103762 RepID=A0A8J5SX06_ZIZPA|nr:hypothetical protein GUJ93_ZPchr0014g46990 [Zizania palustris]